MGSGVIFNAQGHLTNNHVIEDALSSLSACAWADPPARLLGRDPASDLAVIRVDAHDLCPPSLPTATRPRGEWVVASAPLRFGYTVTTGRQRKGVAGRVNSVEDYCRPTRASTRAIPGDRWDELDGRCSDQHDDRGSGQGIGFAVPSNIARRTRTRIVRTGRCSALDGVGIQTSPRSPPSSRLPGRGRSSTACPRRARGEAQLRAGDIVAAVDGRRVHDAQE